MPARIEIDGADVLELDRREREAVSAGIGMLFQAGALFDSLPVWENVAFGLLAGRGSPAPTRPRPRRRGAGAGRARSQRRRPVAGGAVGRHAEARRPGPRHRRQPEILFFDEPTTGLDPIMGAVIDGLIVDCVKRLGSTAIAITHDMASATRIGDRAAMLYRAASSGRARPRPARQRQPAGRPVHPRAPRGPDPDGAAAIEARHAGHGSAGQRWPMLRVAPAAVAASRPARVDGRRRWPGCSSAACFRDCGRSAEALAGDAGRRPLTDRSPTAALGRALASAWRRRGRAAAISMRARPMTTAGAGNGGTGIDPHALTVSLARLMLRPSRHACGSMRGPTSIPAREQALPADATSARGADRAAGAAAAGGGRRRCSRRPCSPRPFRRAEAPPRTDRWLSVRRRASSARPAAPSTRNGPAAARPAASGTPLSRRPPKPPASRAGQGRARRRDRLRRARRARPSRRRATAPASPSSTACWAAGWCRPPSCWSAAIPASASRP